MATWRLMLTATFVATSLLGCAVERQGSADERPAPRAGAPETARLDVAQIRRLQHIMPPLIAHMNDPLPSDQVKITLWSDAHINAANAGGGKFYVTTGLLQKASDDQLRAILAHEIAHADLGHVAKTQTLATGMSIGTLILDQILPGAGSIAPLASELVLNAYSRSEESEADLHAVTIMKRAGLDGKALMANGLTWIQRTEGDSGGGFFASHPATGERIAAIRALP